MANAGHPQSQPPQSLDVLEQMLNEVLVATGKALRASVKDGRQRGTIPTANIGRITECSDTFNTALDDIGEEIIRAKSVLRRDLDRMRPARPEPQQPQQSTGSRPPNSSTPRKPVSQPSAVPPAPMMIDDSPPPEQQRNQPNPGLSARPATTRKPSAPFPDMGMAPEPVNPSPVPATVSAPPQPAAPPSMPAAVKAQAPPKPSPKPVNVGAPKPSPKPSQAAHTNSSAAQPNPTPAVAPPAPMSVAAPGPTDGPAPPPSLPPAPGGPTDVLPGGGMTGPDTHPEMNFTNMQFSPLGDFANATGSPDNLNMAAIGNDILNGYDGGLSQEANKPQTANPAAAPTNHNNKLGFHQPPPTAQSQPGPAMMGPNAHPQPLPHQPPMQNQQQQQQQQQQQKQQQAGGALNDANMDDLFDLGGNNFDTLNMGGGEGGETNNFNEMFFAGGGDTDMGGMGGGFDNAYFGLE